VYVELRPKNPEEAVRARPTPAWRRLAPACARALLSWRRRVTFFGSAAVSAATEEESRIGSKTD